MPNEAILKALTINAAEILGVADRIGSLELGKDVYIIIRDGYPLSIRTGTEKLFSNGKLVYQKD
jgi:imidazolonepropionase-like amidohydrolase